MHAHLTRRLRGICLAAYFAAAAVSASAGQTDRGFVDRVFRDADGEHKYVVFVPHEYTPDRAWPVILFLHSAGERGDDGKRQVEVGLGRAVRARERSFPFIVVFPQCEDRAGPARQGWLPEMPDGKRALAILGEVEKEYRTDPDRVYLTGSSMGGYGAWAHAAADPRRWAAIVPICGGGDPAWAPRIAHLPTWCFHGADDRAVLVTESRRMIKALEQAGGHARYTEYPGVGHNSWDAAYATDELYTWLLEQRRDAPIAAPSPPETPRPVAAPAAIVDNEFVPVIEIPNAAYVRLGSEMLTALGDSLPTIVSPESLRGTLPDATQTTTSQGRVFTVRLSGISYAGRLTRATIEPIGDERLTVTLAVRDVNLVIDRTHVWGQGRSATCGPLRIVLGHRYDLVLAVDVQPIVEHRRVRFKVLDTRFRLPRDNWQVGTPQWVNTRGLGMTRERAIQGLRSGLAGDPGRIEREIIAAVPRLVRQLEDEIQLDRIDRIISELWPFPVYKPRVRTWVTELHTDGDGLTAMLGVAVAAVDGQAAPPQPATVELPGAETARTMPGRDFQFGVSPHLMGPLSAPFVDAAVARVLVQDLPVKTFTALSDPATLGEIAPDLRQRGDREIRAELLLASPARLSRVTTEAGDALEFEVPRGVCAIAVHPSPQSKEWVPYIEAVFRLRQIARPAISRGSDARPSFTLAWQGQAQIDVLARFAAGYSASNPTIDTDRLQAILAAGWREWTETGPLAAIPLDDVDLGFAKFRAEQSGWRGDYLSLAFAPAGIVLNNRTGGEIAYEMKGPFSDWGGPYRLGPQAEHPFRIATPATCRFRTADEEKTYTLAPGSRFEFRSTDDGKIELYLSRDVR